MLKRIWIWLVKLRGWKFDIPEGDHPEWYRCVMIMAPHTAAEDFFAGAAIPYLLHFNVRFLVKKEFFNFFTKPFLRWAGCLPVDRGNPRNNIVNQAVSYFNDHEKLTLLITPEGTRKRVNRWKQGFYQIATHANVPIVLTYMDYGTMHMGIGPTFYPTGDWDSDIKEIMSFYQDKTARHPELFNKQANGYNNDK
ncbi:MAG: 1-acyl-sn-glycerol-3-phosphate acyltransferase [Bacteroidales bacterium]|nr:1-acyl-sn-glycerol-3-phosphate acyltransferase [Bacteroidales bacterium]